MSSKELTQCQCKIEFPETSLLKAEEGWHCLQCGWPVPDNHWRIRLEIARRAYIKMTRDNNAPLSEMLRELEQAAVVTRVLYRGRMIAMAGLICSLIMIVLSLAQLFGLIEHSLGVSITVGFGASATVILVTLNFINWWRSRHG